MKMPQLPAYLQGLFDKYKYILLVLLAGLVLLLWPQSENQPQRPEETAAVMEETAALEGRICAILQQIDGVGEASVLLTVFSYGFALQAMFENPLKTQLANVFKLAVLSPGKTLSLWMITILPVLLIVGLPLNVVAPLGFLYLICGASGPAYLNSRTLRGIFDKVNGSPVVPQ